MSETNGDQLRPPVVFGGNGDIGRTVLQQLAAEGVAPAGVVLTPRRLENEATRREAARIIASNFAPEGETLVLDGAELTADPVLRIGDLEAPVFTPDNQHEILQEGHPVIDATGNNKSRQKVEQLNSAGAPFVVVTSPFKKDAVPTVVYGVNSDDQKFLKALDEGVLSTSSCTTTAVTSFLGPLLRGRERIPLSGALISVMHARTKSNDPADIANNIKLSSSGATKEIPKILGIDADDPEEMIFDLSCTRSNAACGSLATINLLFGHEFHAYNLANLRSGIRRALRAGGSSCVIDQEIKETKGVIGRKESAVLNLGGLALHRLPGTGSAGTGIEVFYDNVAGYTRSVMDSYKRMIELDQTG